LKISPTASAVSLPLMLSRLRLPGSWWAKYAALGFGLDHVHARTKSLPRPSYTIRYVAFSLQFEPINDIPICSRRHANAFSETQSR
jgi:hypothetical protein